MSLKIRLTDRETGNIVAEQDFLVLVTEASVTEALDAVTNLASGFSQMIDADQARFLGQVFDLASGDEVGRFDRSN